MCIPARRLFSAAARFTEFDEILRFPVLAVSVKSPLEYK
jgi:hypothetical protein